jgi:hypothetical protein
MGVTTDRSFDWVAGLAIAAGAAVVIPSLAAFVITAVAVILRLL